ncbi:MAG: hypothetical protein IT385_14290 [Deltaproteobacteria bacterium]|nr:hypothetical protein [Deltaproteobacteria bacterium]
MKRHTHVLASALRASKTGRIARLAGLAACVAACDPHDDAPRGEGEVCYLCTESTSGTFGGGCAAWDEWECQPGLFCDGVTSNTCTRYRAPGEACGPSELCSDAGVCGPQGTCLARPTLSARCDAQIPCVAPLVCNSGGAPDDPRAGTCTEPLGQVGDACAWRHTTRGFVGSHCAAGLSCVPQVGVDDAPLTPDRFATDGCAAIDEDGYTNADGRCLGWPGTCQAPGQGARGAPCAGDDACGEGPCVRLPPPLLDAGQGEPVPYTAPWPGVCAAASDAIVDPVCRAGGGCALACATSDDCLPGTLCTPFGGRCHAMRLVAAGAWCGQYDMRPTFADDRWCRVGLTCDLDAMTCRAAGTTAAGAACAAHADCAPGLVCAGTCVAPAGAGEPCDAARRCDFDLRCDRGAEICEPPGPVQSGGACGHDDDCGRGLYCEDDHDTCQWLARLGEPCSEASLACEPGLTCALEGEGGICR